MGCNVVEHAHMLEASPNPKVHISMCNELANIMNRILRLIPEIESARPGCMLGIMELCSLNNSIEKVKIFIEHCAESSKLYMAITGDVCISRCERIRSAMEKNLTHIHTMVPEPLATKISDAIDSLKDTKFIIDFSEDEACKSLLSLLCQSDATEELELKTFRIATSRLHLTSSKEILVERRCVQKLLNKIGDDETKKARILRYLMYLLKTYGKKVQAGNSDFKEDVCEAEKEPLAKESSPCNGSFNENICIPTGTRQQEEVEHVAHCHFSDSSIIPEEFKCPISSKLMQDPVVIASGQTYERACIEKWFSDGHNTCPKTQMELSDHCIYPNSSMKDLISQWCHRHGFCLQHPCTQSISASFNSWDSLNSSSTSLNSVSAVLLDNRKADYIFQNDHSNISVISSDCGCYSYSSQAHYIENSSVQPFAQMFTWSDDYKKCQSFSGFSSDSYMRFLLQLSELPLELHSKALEDLKICLGKDDDTCSLMLCNGFFESLVRFTKDAYDSSNETAQKDGVQILLALLRSTRNGIPSLHDDVYHLLMCFLDSKTLNLEALMVVHSLCFYPDCKSSLVASGVSRSIINILDSEDTNLMEVAVEILSELSLLEEIASLILSTGCLPKLVTLLGELKFAGNCLRILRNLGHTDDGVAAIATADGCICSIVENLEYNNQNRKTDAVAVLLSLCSCSSEYCDLVLKEGVIPSLVEISVNGNLEGQEHSKKLLQLLRDRRNKDTLETPAQIGGSLSASPPCLESNSPSTIGTSTNGNLQGHNNHLQSLNHSGVTSAESPKKVGNHSKKKNPTSKASGFFGRKIFLFPKRKSLTQY